MVKSSIGNGLLSGSRQGQADFPGDECDRPRGAQWRLMSRIFMEAGTAGSLSRARTQVPDSWKELA